MAYRFSFPKEQRISVAGDDRALLGVAYQGPDGRIESYGPCDARVAIMAFMVVQQICDGASLDDAVATAKKKAEEFDARQAGNAEESA